VRRAPRAGRTRRPRLAHPAPGSSASRFGPEGAYLPEGTAPDVEVLQDAAAMARGRNPQLERAVAEALRLVETQGVQAPRQPARFPIKARRPAAAAGAAGGSQ
jgi:tricorn protease